MHFGNRIAAFYPSLLADIDNQDHLQKGPSFDDEYITPNSEKESLIKESSQGARLRLMKLMKSMPINSQQQPQEIERLETKISVEEKEDIMRVVVIDEIDNLITSGKNGILPELFSWTQAESSRLILIGISNAVALTDDFHHHLASYSINIDKKTLPSNISSSSSSEPQKLVFAPYTCDELVRIIAYRIKTSLNQPTDDDNNNNNNINESSSSSCISFCSLW